MPVWLWFVLGGVALAGLAFALGLVGGEKKADKKVKKAEREIPERVAEKVVEKIGASPARPLSPTGGTAPAPTPAPAPTSSPSTTPAAAAPASDLTLIDWFRLVKVTCLGQRIRAYVDTSVAQELQPFHVKKGRNFFDLRFEAPVGPKIERDETIDGMRRPGNWGILPLGMGIEIAETTEPKGCLNFDLGEPPNFDANFQHPMRIKPVFRPEEDTEQNTTEYWIGFVGEESMVVTVRVPFDVVKEFDDELRASPRDPDLFTLPSYILVSFDFGNLPNTRSFHIPLILDS